MTVRISKYLADCGIASRRGAEELINKGVVSVNGVVVDTPVFFINGDEVVCVNGKEIKPNDKTELYMFHKPINTMTTAKDPDGRKTIYDVLGERYHNLKYIGRLDYKTTGLLLMTNRGDLARQMSLPQNHIPRTYIATVNQYTKKGLDVARKGVTVDGVKYRPMKIEIIDETHLRITVTEGKKNEIRIVLKHIGSPVVALHRISYGIINIDDLKVGKISKVDAKTVDLVVKKLLESK